MYLIMINCIHERASFLHTFYIIKEHVKQLCCAHAQDWLYYSHDSECFPRTTFPAPPTTKCTEPSQ